MADYKGDGGVYQDSEIAREAIKLLVNKKQSCEDATCFVTEKIAFKMRDLIKSLRKNYFGIFDNPIDSITKREKIWIPLTESVVDAAVKNIDLDTKDINFRAKRGKSRGLTSIVRNIVKNYLDALFFGEYLDDLERTLGIDGTAVWKTYEDVEDYENKTMCIDDVDLLNFYIEPTAKAINHRSTDGVMERGLLSPDAVKAMKGWFNTDAVEGFTGMSINDSNLGIPSQSTTSDTKLTEVFEYWGQMPLFLMTGKQEDKKTMIEGHIVVSNLIRNPLVHLIEKNKKGVRPYEEAWYSRVRGRWYGRGPAEKVMMLQLWLNIIVNIRINRSYVSQLGLFKIRQGSGVTPQMMGKLTVNGGVFVKDMKDIEQLIVSEASQASYNDENIINQWSQKVTSLFESVTGEAMPSQTTATNGVISNRSASSNFVFIKKGIGMFLQRWIKRHVFPIISKNIKRSDVIRITGEVDELREIDERLANQLLFQKLDGMNKNGEFFQIPRVEKERQRIIAKLQAGGTDRYIEMMQDIDLGEYDVQVYVTNEEADKGVLIQNLVSVLQTLPNLPQAGIDPVAVANAIFDLMGLDTSQLKAKQPPQAPPQMQPNGQTAPAQGAGQPIQKMAAMAGASNPQPAVTDANTM